MMKFFTFMLIIFFLIGVCAAILGMIVAFVTYMYYLIKTFW